jgi:hypothetical protein
MAFGIPKSSIGIGTVHTKVPVEHRFCGIEMARMNVRFQVGPGQVKRNPAISNLNVQQKIFIAG